MNTLVKIEHNGSSRIWLNIEDYVEKYNYKNNSKEFMLKHKAIGQKLPVCRTVVISMPILIFWTYSKIGKHVENDNFSKIGDICYMYLWKISFDISVMIAAKATVKNDKGQVDWIKRYFVLRKWKKDCSNTHVNFLVYKVQRFILRIVNEIIQFNGYGGKWGYIYT